MCDPDQNELREASGEGKESPHDVHQFLEAARDFQRDYEQGNSKTKHNITERFQTSNFASPPMEVFFWR